MAEMKPAEGRKSLHGLRLGHGRIFGYDGIQSLQSALYAAGARTSITSLWKVDDTMTQRLMEALYDNLWVQGMCKSDALWQTMRDEGDPPVHWAGWVLTGDLE